MNKQPDTLEDISALIIELSNKVDISHYYYRPHFSLARAWLLDNQMGTILRGQGPVEKV